MLNVGDIKHGKKNNYVYQACIDCGKERWVSLIRSVPRSVRCLECTKLLLSYRSNISKANIGHVAWNKGIPHSEETKVKMRKYKSWLGRHHTDSSKLKMSLTKKGIVFSEEHRHNLSLSHRDVARENNSNWSGGVTPLAKSIRGLKKYRDWRSYVYERDNFTCQKCNKIGGRLNAHHKKPFARILQDNNITDYQDAILCDELWDINNGITLCEDGCHVIEGRG